jgi:hypothetical protein
MKLEVRTNRGLEWILTGDAAEKLKKVLTEDVRVNFNNSKRDGASFKIKGHFQFELDGLQLYLWDGDVIKLVI